MSDYRLVHDALTEKGFKPADEIFTAYEISECIEKLHITKTDPVAKLHCNPGVISDAATLEVINTAIGTAVSIVNMSDDENIEKMAVNIADTLIALTGVENL